MNVHPYVQPPHQMQPRQGQYPQPPPQQAGQHGQPRQSRVAHLNSKHFQTKDTIHGKLLILTTIQEPTFVMFHTDDCSVCQRVIPEYEAMAQSLPYRFASCNLTQNRDVLNMAEPTVSPITHVPRLYVYSNGWPHIVYKDSWDPTKMKQFMEVSWRRAIEQSAGSQAQTHRPQASQFNPTQSPHLSRPPQGRIAPVEHPVQGNGSGIPPSQYAVVGTSNAPNISCDANDCGNGLISFNEVLCEGSHGCYAVTDLPANGQ
jgi:thiol-disulfide isomerase/thioredoxin